MKLPHMLLGAAIAVALSVTMMAQTAPSGYHSVACIKVKRESMAEFRKWVESDARKFAQARVDSGAYSSWMLLRNIIPQGEAAQCDYTVVSMYPGSPAKPMGMDELGEVLKKAGVTATAREYVDKRTSLTTLVYSYMSHNEAYVGAMHKGDYFVVNYMKADEANMHDYVEYEKKVWKPFAEQLLKDGARTGWSLNTIVFPEGSRMRYNAVTVDVYPSWDALYKDYNFMEGWKKVHPDMDATETFAKYAKLRTMVDSEVFEVEDMISAK